MFEILCLFKELCSKHRLKYFVMGGTLLGAVRHRGFIPWDDDADVSMPLEDFLRFMALAEDLPADFTVQSEEAEAE